MHTMELAPVSDVWGVVFTFVATDTTPRLRLVCRGWACALDSPAYWTNLPPDDRRAHLRHCCKQGLLLAAQWLTASFKLTTEDARAYDNYALRGACAYGHLAVAQWLVAAFELVAT